MLQHLAFNTMLLGGYYGGLENAVPKRAKELTPIEVKRLGEGVHAVGGVPGLCLQVSAGAGKSWVLRAVVGIKRREIGLGSYPEVGLGAARSAAAEMRNKIRQGIDPVQQRKSAKTELIVAQRRGLLFSVAVDLFEPVKAIELSEGKYRDHWRDSLDKYAVPVLGPMLVQDIALQDILLVLEPIWTTKHTTADKLRRKINEVLDYCTVKGHRTGPNPARWGGNLSHVLGTKAGNVSDDHFPALQLQDLPRFWEALKGRHGMGAAALQFQTLTATRAGAVRFMTWDEIDLEARVWTVQPGRQSSKIKAKDAPGRVPLTDEMVELLKALPRQQDGNLVFWAPRGGALSDAVMGKLMRTLHEADLKAGNRGFLDAKSKEVVVPHGTRSSFKNWSVEKTSYEWQLSEAALWHRLGGKVETSYARTDMIERRRRMMEDWGRFVMGMPAVDAQVIPLAVGAK